MNTSKKIFRVTGTFSQHSGFCKNEASRIDVRSLRDGTYFSKYAKVLNEKGELVDFSGYFLEAEDLKDCPKVKPK